VNQCAGRTAFPHQIPPGADVSFPSYPEPSPPSGSDSGSGSGSGIGSGSSNIVIEVGAVILLLVLPALVYGILKLRSRSRARTNPVFKIRSTFNSSLDETLNESRDGFDMELNTAAIAAKAAAQAK